MQVEKDFNFWIEDENKKVWYNVRARYIISSAFTMEEFYKVSTCENAKDMRESMEKAQEGIKEPDRNNSKSSNNNKDINTCFMIDVESQQSKISTSNSNIQAKYDELLDTFEELQKKQMNLIV